MVLLYEKRGAVCIRNLPCGPLPAYTVISAQNSAFPAILVYAQEMLPDKLGLVSGLFFGFAFGVAGIAAAILGHFVDIYGLQSVFDVCAFSPLAGLVAAFLPNMKNGKRG